MTPRHTSDHTRVLDAQCTCNGKPMPDGPEWDPRCPRHSVDAQLHRADQTLDIDTSYVRKEAS